MPSIKFGLLTTISTQVKGLLPDEEKEKIGPKNVQGATKLKATSASVIKQQPSIQVVSGFWTKEFWTRILWISASKAVSHYNLSSSSNNYSRATSTADFNCATFNYDDASTSNGPYATSINE